jgi:hypothetical protein
MSEVSNLIDNEVGRDTEHMRVTFMKYVGYGRRLEREDIAAAGGAKYTEAQHAEAVKAAVTSVATEIFTELTNIMHTASVAADKVERELEKVPFAELMKHADDGPIKAEMLAKFEELLATVDKAHTAVIHERNVAIDALRAKFVGQ